VSTQHSPVRWGVVLVTLAAIALASATALQRLCIESDLTASIPGGTRTLEGSRTLLRTHPIVDRVAVDLSVSDGSPAPARLVAAADQVQERLKRSGLFASVGMGRSAPALAQLSPQVAESLPVLFSRQELGEQVAPRLGRDQVRATIRDNFEQLVELSSVGSSALLARDPLRLRDLVLRRLTQLAPLPDARLQDGHILSSDGRHLLLTALPQRSAGDPATSRHLERLFDEVAAELARATARDGRSPVLLTVAGAFRSAVDNERVARSDTRQAVVLVALGIAVLLLLSFRRPLLGLLALIPATAGVAGALLLYSLVSPSLSALALGFGAALVSITVDQGIVYVSFLDRLPSISARQAAREVLPATLLATVTTAGAFLALRLSGYELLAQLGSFAALGVVLSFAFVQLLFPLFFRGSVEAPRRALLPVDRWLRRLVAGPARLQLAVPAALALVMLAFAKPTFRADLHALNTVSPATRAAEERIRNVWGDVFSNVYVFLQAQSIEALQQRADELAVWLGQQRAAGAIESGWSPSLLFPGPQLAARHAAAWRQFWTSERRQTLEADLASAGGELGFAEDAFQGFMAATRLHQARALEIPEQARPLLGIHRARDNSGWVWLGAVRRGPHYDAERFAEQAAGRHILVFDGNHFSSALGQFLETAFLRMLLIIGGFIVLCVCAAFLDVRLALSALAPVGFGLVCTLGTLTLLGRAIDIPGLMLAIVVLGMGIDFAFHFLRGYQRHPRVDDMAHDPVRVAVWLASSSTLVGMASLALAEHAALRSAGMAGLVSIAFCAVGTFLILPPLQRRFFGAQPAWPRLTGATRGEAAGAVCSRYRHLEPQPRIYAWLKLRLDPMFARLHELVGSAQLVLDIGCGYGVPAVWLAMCDERRRLVALDPDPTRARIAAWALGGRAKVCTAAAPDLPETAGQADAALLLDVAHYLSDDVLAMTLRSVYGRLSQQGRLIVRETVPSSKRLPWERWTEQSVMRLRGMRARFRSADRLTSLLESAGFSVSIEPTPGREETWFVACK
jgi:predicted exporter/SAM-dependent methyltransferase